MREAGVSSRSRVVAYDQVTGAAARAWWLLRAAGVEQVSVLDGGLGAYLEAGGVLSQEVPEPPPGDLSPRGFSGQVSADLIPRLQEQGHLVLDARSQDRYHGVPNPLDPRPGHLPGAKSLPWMELFPEGFRLDGEAVQSRLRELGHSGQPIIAYCGSGVTACALLLALEGAQVKDIHLYPGSWSEWAGDPSRPVEREL
jgi:thiosulfate/3-mercaptopyruvate sulfurtransferase